MKYVNNFYRSLKEGLSEARVHAALFLPMMTEQDLTKKYGSLWRKKSLFGALKSFNKQPFGLMELVCLNKDLLKKFSSFHQNRMVNRLCTDYEFIKPLTAFAEGFAVIDGRDVYVQPDAQHPDNGAFVFSDNSVRAAYFQNLFTQITAHEFKMDNYQPTDSFLNLAPSNQTVREMLAYFDDIQSHRISDVLPNNAFLKRLIKKYRGEA